MNSEKKNLLLNFLTENESFVLEFFSMAEGDHSYATTRKAFNLFRFCLAE